MTNMRAGIASAFIETNTRDSASDITREFHANFNGITVIAIGDCGRRGCGKDGGGIGANV